MQRLLILVVLLACRSPVAPGELPPLAPCPGAPEPTTPKLPPVASDAGVPSPKPAPVTPQTAVLAIPSATIVDAGAPDAPPVDARPIDAALPPLRDASVPVDAPK